MTKKDDDTILDLERSFNDTTDRDPDGAGSKEDFDEDGPTKSVDLQALIERVSAAGMDPTDPVPVVSVVRHEAPTEQVRAPTPSTYDTDPELDGNRFEILERIGGGAMADLYRAIDRWLSMPGSPVFVAIKLFKRGQLGRQTIDRIKIEARAALSVQHKHICRVHGLVAFPDGRYGLVMELIEGRPLSAILRERPAIDYLRFARWGAEIASALDAAHQADFVHRDLKPENIMIRDADDSAVLLDFGIAKFFQEAIDLTGPGEVLGSLPYMAPEQFAHQVDPRTDLYALGLVLVQLATGRVPWCGDGTLGSIINERVTHARTYRLRDEVPSAPVEYAMIVGRLLALRPEDRFATGVHVAEALSAFIRNVEADTRLPMAKVPARARDTKPMRARPLPPPLPDDRPISDVVVLPTSSRTARIFAAAFVALIATLLTVALARGHIRVDAIASRATLEAGTNFEIDSTDHHRR
jgi:serine/threonine protein kinase